MPCFDPKTNFGENFIKVWQIAESTFNENVIAGLNENETILEAISDLFFNWSHSR